MKKKVVFLFAAIAVTLLTVKSGYAYYENVSQKENNKIVSVNQTNEQGTKVAAATIPVETATNTEENANTNSFIGCGSGYGSMIDENGNFKDRDTYEQELNGYIDEGLITEEDKENYLSLYDLCASQYFSESDSEESNNASFPSCH
ncbi:MAG: hypothetical protein K0S41_3491 [Anaerocolumna sp.]|jgi:hypothetical protein|nr:hypothetical protein [Anaerocolumna sp.]